MKSVSLSYTVDADMLVQRIPIPDRTKMTKKNRHYNFSDSID